MIISHRHAFIFLKTQKTAGSSVELALSEICGPDDVITRMNAEERGDSDLRRGPQNFDVPPAYRPWGAALLHRLGARARRSGFSYFQHMPAALVRRRMNPAQFDAYRKVTIVRNAWDREVSLYFWATRRLSDKPSFDSFVRRRVWRPEMKTFEIYAIKGHSVADTVLRYETLAEDFAAFVQSLGVEQVPELPRAKGNFRAKAKRDYRDFYTDETAEIVRRRYAREIALFGMAF
ncbi:sulfotransferase family 2 domain-containing protein [Roseicyclus elongatus]|nr:sulfotransferase family 2 domain-containing protein [Roseibacterium elongatum]